MSGLTRFVDLAAGPWHVAGVDEHGDLWAWGRLPRGAATFSVEFKPTRLRRGASADAKWRAVAATRGAVIASDERGRLVSWGSVASHGADPTRALDEEEPTAVATLSSDRDPLLAGGGLCALAGLGGTDYVVAWGVNPGQSLGTTVVDPIAEPAAVKVPGDGWSLKQLAAGDSHFIALTNDGELFTWGWNTLRKRTDIASSYLTRPTLVPNVTGLPAVAKVVAGGGDTLALGVDGTLWGWGANIDATMGVGDRLSRFAPIQIEFTDADLRIADCSIGRRHALAVDESGGLWSWGANPAGGLGTGDLTYADRPRLVTVAGEPPMLRVWAGHGYSFAQDAEGELWCWGYNSQGVLGLGDLESRSAPVRFGTR